MRLTIILSSMLFMLFGCAAKKLAIRNADTFIVRAIEKRLPLTSEQSDELSREVDHFLNLTKADARKLKTFLDTVDLRQAEKVDGYLESLTTQYVAIANDFSHMVARQLAALSEVQQEKLFKNLEKENAEIERKEKKDALKNFTERFSYFFGSTTQAQKNLAASFTEHYKERTVSRIAARRALQEKLRGIYANPLTGDSRLSAIHQELVSYQKQRLDPKLPEIVQKFQATLTAEQLSHFNANKQELKELLDYFVSVDY